MSAIVRAGERGLDFSFAHPPPARLLEPVNDVLYTFVVGYISVPPASPGKNLSRAECEAYVEAGLKVLLVWEMDAARPNKGAPYGAIDGKAAAQCARDRGYPTDVPILSAADLNTWAGNITQHEAYMRAFEENCGPWQMGVYGDTDILMRTSGLWSIGWVPLGAWAWSGTSYANARAKSIAVGAHVLQRTGFHIDNTWAVDPNDAIADFPAWGVEEQEDEMALVEVLVPSFTGMPDWFPYLACFDNGTVRPLGPSKMTPTLGQTPITDEGQYRRISAAAGIQLELQFPPCLDEHGFVVGPGPTPEPSPLPDARIVWDK